MKTLQLSMIATGVLLSSAAMANQYAENKPAYQYDRNAGVIANTTGAVAGTTRTLFDTITNPASVSAEVGTLGYGANVAFSLDEKTELVAGWAGGDVAELAGGDIDVNDIEYDVEMDLSNPYLGVNLRPAANWFTVGAGVIVPGGDIEARANPNDDGYYQIDDTRYFVGNADDEAVADAGTDAVVENVGQLVGELEHRNELAPYLTVGFRPNINSNLGVFGEIGAAYMGEVDATVRATGRAEDGFDPDNARLAEREAERELESEDYLEFYPIAKLGLTYRF